MSAIENIFGMLPDRFSSGKQDQIFTPPHIAKEMINALPEEVWNRHTTFFDPICKSGIFLYEIYEKLMESADLIEAFPDKQLRREHILKNQLFGIAVDQMCQLMSTRTVYGYLAPDNHIILLSDYLTVMRNTDKRFLLETLQKEFGTMKFDVVIGNPPYNRGMDLDFVDLGYKLSNKYTCMITPAKWQTAEADQSVSSKISYGQFRQLYVPHMQYVKFYPSAKDIFDISIKCGITYFILDKDVHEVTFVENEASFNQQYFVNKTKRNIKGSKSLFNIGNEIIDSLGDYKVFSFPMCKENPENMKVFNSCCFGGSGSSPIHPYASSDGKCSVTCPCVIGKIPIGSDKTIFQGNENECKSFVSWVDTKFVRFFMLMRVCDRSGLFDNNYFRFVPAPPSGKFDHIYTDKELYEAFNLPQKYIDVIEAVIKERK